MTRSALFSHLRGAPGRTTLLCSATAEAARRSSMRSCCRLRPERSTSTSTPTSASVFGRCVPGSKAKAPAHRLGGPRDGVNPAVTWPRLDTLTQAARWSRHSSGHGPQIWSRHSRGHGPQIANDPPDIRTGRIRLSAYDSGDISCSGPSFRCRRLTYHVGRNQRKGHPVSLRGPTRH